MIIQCAWCGIKIEETKGQDEMVSHGICEDCEKIIQEQMDDAK